MPREKGEGGRAFWSGTITFGLVTVPINLFPANRSGGVHWRMLDEDGTPLRRRFFLPDDNEEIDSDDLIRGYEIEEGEYVVVTDDELAALAPRKSRDIDLRAFVNEDEIEPLYFERSYFLTPAGESSKAYRLLAASMEHKKQAGIATFVMRDKEYLVAILAENGILRAETLRFKDEVRSPSDVGLGSTPQPEKKRVDHILREITKIKEPKLKQSLLENEYAERVQKLLEQKNKQYKDVVKIKTDDVEEEDADIDIMAMIKRSLGQSSNGNKTRQTKSRSKARVTSHSRPTAKSRTPKRRKSA